jgi:HK97 family phage prohead protease
MGKRNYDFAGWVTKNDIVCSDGVTIKHDAFRDNDGQKVPLVWNHDYNSPGNVLGHVMLHNQATGVYGYGYFNDTEEAVKAKELVKHGDISSMSIGARNIKRNGTNVTHGRIYEVSLVLSGANPGAMIETVVTHSDDGKSEEKGIVYTGTLIHSFDDIIKDEDKGGVKEVNEDELNKTDDKLEHSEKTIGDVIDSMTEEQKNAVYALMGMMADDMADEEDGETEDIDNNEGDKTDMKQNVFSKNIDNKKDENLKHAYTEVLKTAQANKVSSLKDVLLQQAGDDTLTHGINSIEMLFPDAYQSTNGNVPILYRDTNTAALRILESVSKSPFSRVKTLIADLTEDEARAKGYIKGNMKKEEYFSLVKRQTGPTTVYKKQKLDRDDVLDITDFDVVSFMNVEMQMMLKEEIARALLVGDGRDFSAEDKINEQNIRPIVGDHEFFTIYKSFTAVNAFIEAVIKAMAEYKGSGNPDMFIDPVLLADVKLLKGTDGRYLFGDIPSNQAIANRLGLNEVIPSTFMTGKGAVIVNLRDYTLGATKGGQVTSFDDFDIDFNQYKYLIETRLSGALTMPKSAIHLQLTTAETGANNTDAGLTYSTRQADKSTTTTTTV